MVSGDGFFRLESDTSRTAAGATLYQWQNNEWVLVGYHSKRLPDAVRNYGVTELELTGLLANIHGFEQKLNNNYFEAIVDHKAIDYLIKSKHEPTSTRLVTLLDRLNRYTFDLKYLEGSKLKVSDALSHLYSEEKHKISDVIPLNFLLHFTDYQLHKESDKLANKLYAYKRTKLSTKTRCSYDRQAKHKPVDRYEPSEPTKKVNKVLALQEIPIKSLTSNERQIKAIGNMINKHLTQKGASWPLYAAVSAYAMNTFVSTALQGLSPFELVFARKPRQLTSFELPKITSFPVEYREFFRLLLDRAKMYSDMEMEWRTLQALELRDKNKMLTNIETFQPNDLVYLLAPYSSSLQSKAQKFRQDYIGPLAIDTKLDDIHYLLKDVTGRTLPGDYHINRIKRAKEVTPDGLADTYEQLRNQIGLPNDACALPLKSSAAQLRIK